MSLSKSAQQLALLNTKTCKWWRTNSRVGYRTKTGRTWLLRNITWQDPIQREISVQQRLIQLAKVILVHRWKKAWKCPIFLQKKTTMAPVGSFHMVPKQINCQGPLPSGLNLWLRTIQSTTDLTLSLQVRIISTKSLLKLTTMQFLSSIQSTKRHWTYPRQWPKSTTLPEVSMDHPHWTYRQFLMSQRSTNIKRHLMHHVLLSSDHSQQCTKRRHAKWSQQRNEHRCRRTFQLRAICPKIKLKRLCQRRIKIKVRR